MPKKKTKPILVPTSTNPVDIIFETLTFIEDANPELISTIRVAFQEVIAEKDQIKDQIQTLYNEKQEVIQQLEQVESEYKDYIEKLENQIKIQIKSYLDLSGSIMKEIQLHEKEIQSLQKVVEKKTALLVEGKTEIENLNKQLIHFKRDYTHIKTEYDKTINDLNLVKQSYQEQVIVLQNELTQKVNKINDMVSQAAEYQAMLKKYKSKCVVL